MSDLVEISSTLINDWSKMLQRNVRFTANALCRFSPYYCPPTKIRESNVFSRVCSSVCSQRVPPPQIYSNLFNLDLTVKGQWLLDMFKLVHYETRTVSKRVLLDCFLVVRVCVW